MKLRLLWVLGIVCVMGSGLAAGMVDLSPGESYEATRQTDGWTPAAKPYVLENTSTSWVYWQATDSEGVVVCSPEGGWIPPGGAVTVHLSPGDAMNAATPGEYSTRLRLDFDPRVAGDLDGDGVVTMADVLQVAMLFGGTDGRADFDCSGQVDIFDLLTIINNFGKDSSGVAI